MDISKLQTDLGMQNIPEFQAPRFDVPKFVMPPMPTGHLASGVHERILGMIQDFENSLDDSYEVGARLANFGTSVLIRVTDIGYHNPTLIRFFGFLDETGEPCELIQNVNQLSLLLIRVPILDPAKPKRRIGFHEDP